jgi:4-alpha-glucanotransferase
MIGAKSYREYNNLPDWQKKRFDDLSNYYFYKRHNDMWYNNAMKKLQQLIASTNMLTCGEDLGMLNPSVHACMANLKILSLELQIMPKETGRKLGDPASYPYLSVCTTSTHDSETLRMWLGKLLGTDMGELESFENGKSVVLKDASPEECKKVLIQNLNSPSMLAIFPIQDWLSINDRLRNKHVNSERINYPDDPDNYWRYRLHINLEDMIAAKSFNNEIADMVNGSGRNKETEN